MPTVDQQRQKLLTLLKELFQINQPDLDFGFYRIMHAKADEVSRFLDKDLLQIIAEAFGETSSEKQVELKKAYLDEIETARQYGAEKPEEAPKVKEAKARWESALDTANAEGEVYDHLYRFFERYYDNGDFLSKRYYARESTSKAAPYAVPYDGSEVYLHWANKDQYYIKTSEYFTDFTFDLSRAKEVEGQLDPLFSDQEPPAMRVHFRIAEATEGEHGNIKATNGQRRYFILHDADSVALENSELIIRFEYRPDPEKSGQDNVWQRKRIEQAVDKIFEKLDGLKGADNFATLLKLAAPTEKQRDRTLLAKYLTKYSARNTMDYFIHKDLGGFLQRELDFYIKNEIMRLDDIENAEASQVGQYLSKIKVFRKISRMIITFLAQLEEFQKKLWLKKKFVTETNYCVTLDRVPEEFYPDIVANESQHDEWVRLFAIDEIEADLHSPGYSKPLSLDFLKAHRNLIIDTVFFNNEFRAALTGAFKDLDESCDGLLIHSENFQALKLIQDYFREIIRCVYIDPPYNTGSDEFPYKDGYQASSWFSMMDDRASAALQLMSQNALFFVQIGDDEAARSRLMLERIFPERKNSVVARRGIKNVQAQFDDIDRLNLGHDVIHIFAKKQNLRLPHLRKRLENGKPGKWDTFWRGTDRPTMRYPLFGHDPESGQWRWEKNRTAMATANYDYYLSKEIKRKSIDEWYAENLQAGIDLDFVRLNNDGVVQYYVPPQDFRLVSDNWLDIPSTGSLTDFPHEKSISLLQRIIKWNTSPGDWVLDYFGGSGSTAHAAINFGPGKARKYVTIEMGDYFDCEMKPRVMKFVYSKSWKNGKPAEHYNGISHCFKYLRLESYEDCLNNLEFCRDETRDKAISNSKKLREEYMINYMLDTETRGSQSLLNIDHFVDPTAYELKVKKPGTDESEISNVDLIETFNYLIGLRVTHMDIPQAFTAKFEREPDPELPDDNHTRLKIASRKQATDGPWWFRKIEGWVPGGNGKREKVLIVWRKLTGDLEKDNLMLDEWFKTIRVNPRDFEFDTIYVNGSNNLPNLRLEGENWKVRLIEEDFMKRMWDVEDV